MESLRTRAGSITGEQRRAGLNALRPGRLDPAPGSQELRLIVPKTGFGTAASSFHGPESVHREIQHASQGARFIRISTHPELAAVPTARGRPRPTRVLAASALLRELPQMVREPFGCRCNPSWRRFGRLVPTPILRGPWRFLRARASMRLSG